MSSEARATVICVAALCLTFAFVMSLVYQSGRKGDVEETKRIQTCLQTGGSYTNVAHTGRPAVLGCVKN